MLGLTKKISKKAGLAPGTLVHVGEKKVEKVRIRVIDYSEDHIEERELDTIEQCLPYKDTHTITWINIDGLHEVELVQEIGKCFGLHALVLEDIVHTEQRAKVEEFKDHVFIITKMLSFEEETDHIRAEQFSLVLGPNYVLSFQERYGDVFNPVRERLRKKGGRFRRMGADYLMYALMDAIVDHYFGVLEMIGERLETLEDGIVADPGPDILQQIHHFRKELIFLRKSMWPLRELIHEMQAEESQLIKDRTTIYLRDVYDHIIQATDMIEAFRDIVGGMHDAYLSGISNKMNEVMKVLTIIATIFIPVTFVAGLYGMNFKYMPELEFPWGYPAALGLMSSIAGVMMIWFRRKRFL
jgi:magnesium transporter